MKTYEQKFAEAVEQHMRDCADWTGDQTGGGEIVFLGINIDAIIASVPRPEPVCYQLLRDGVWFNIEKTFYENIVNSEAVTRALYAAPVSAEQAKPAPELTDERIKEIGIESHQGVKDGLALRFARAIERELRGEGK